MEARTNKLASEKIELDVLTMQDLFGVADANLKLLERELGLLKMPVLISGYEMV